MTRAVDAGAFTALQARRLVARDFIWFVVRDRLTGNPVTDGYWSGTGTMTADVLDPETSAVVAREFVGAGGLIKISDVPLVSNLTVQNVEVTLSQISERVNDLVRGYDCKQGKVQIFRGLFDPVTRALAAPAFPRFAGTIDEAPIRTPEENRSGDVVLTCTGNTQELTRANSDTRSGASQKLRDPDDEFYRHTPTVSEWQQYWGKTAGRLGVTGGPPSPLEALRGSGLL